MTSNIVLILYLIVGLYVAHAFVSAFEEDNDDTDISACLLPVVFLLWPLVCIAVLLGWILDS